MNCKSTGCNYPEGECHGTCSSRIDRKCHSETELETLRAQVATLTAERDLSERSEEVLITRGAKMQEQLARLETEVIRRDRLDAERYRWLRENENGVSYCVEHEGNIGSTIWMNGEELDAAIDAAISECKQNEN